MNALVTLPALMLQSTFTQALPTLVILSVSVAIIIVLVVKPAFLFRKKRHKEEGYRTIDDLYNEAKKEREASIDEILEKIHKKGLHSLNKKEKEILSRHSENGSRKN